MPDFDVVFNVRRNVITDYVAGPLAQPTVRSGKVSPHSLGLRNSGEDSALGPRSKIITTFLGAV